MIKSLRCLRPLCVSNALKYNASIKCEMSTEQSNLAQLRKKTGFAYSLCRKALDLHEQDIDKAEVWLKAEATRHGYERAPNINDRIAVQGLVSIYTEPDSSRSTMIEVNCETDFVARNDLFRTLVSKLTREMALYEIGAQHIHNGNLSKITFSSDDLKKFHNDDVMIAITKLGEKIKLSRGMTIFNNLRSEGVQLIGYTHAVGGRIEPDQQNVILGKYGTIVAVKPNPVRPDVENDTQKTPEEVSELGKQIAQHIIGMNPKTIEPKSEIVEEEPSSLLQQEFVFEEDMSVADYLNEVNVKILDFVRFECGVSDP